MQFPARVRSASLVLVILALSFTSAPALSQCISGSTQSERDLWAKHNCWWDFVLWQHDAYNMHSPWWGAWGFNDACNLNRPFAKAVNASYLVTYGLSESPSRQWHGTKDYRNAAEGDHSDNHPYVTITPSTDRSWFGLAHPGFTRIGCRLFDGTSSSSNPASRAGTYVHEGWHHWEFARLYFGGHMTGPVGSCTLTGGGCDWYYSHGFGAYAFGTMHAFTRDGRYFHSPTQAQSEFLCDVAVAPKSWLPASVRIVARNEANFRLATRFRNSVSYRCGKPVPW